MIWVHYLHLREEKTGLRDRRQEDPWTWTILALYGCYCAPSSHRPYKAAMSLFLFYNWGSWGVKRWGDIPKDTRLKQSWTQAVFWLQGSALSWFKLEYSAPTHCPFHNLSLSRARMMRCGDSGWPFWSKFLFLWQSYCPRSHCVIGPN